MMPNFSSPEAAHLLLSVDNNFLTQTICRLIIPFFLSGINSIFFPFVFKVRSQAAGLRRSVQAYPEEEGQDHQEAGAQVRYIYFPKFFQYFLVCAVMPFVPAMIWSTRSGFCWAQTTYKLRIV
jgi:hypothetical protein